MRTFNNKVPFKCSHDQVVLKCEYLSSKDLRFETLIVINNKDYPKSYKYWINYNCPYKTWKGVNRAIDKLLGYVKPSSCWS